MPQLSRDHMMSQAYSVCKQEVDAKAWWACWLRANAIVDVRKTSMPVK